MIQRLANWGVTDWAAVILWLTSILVLTVRSIEPLARHWGNPLVVIGVGRYRRAVMPGLIMVAPLSLALMPLMAQLSPRPGLPNLWLTPGRLLGFTPFLIILIYFMHARFRAALLRPTAARIR